MKKIIAALTLSMCFVSYFASANELSQSALSDSANLISSAREEIQYEQETGSTQTACDLYLEKVLARAGYKVAHFLANDFDKVIHQDMPNWKSHDVTANVGENLDENRAALRYFLNSFPDGTVFLTQWARIERNGHVAMIVKETEDIYIIYQAQMGLSLPAARPITIEGMLYPKNQWGDRSHIRLFFE